MFVFNALSVALVCPYCLILQHFLKWNNIVNRGIQQMFIYSKSFIYRHLGRMIRYAVMHANAPSQGTKYPRLPSII